MIWRAVGIVLALGILIAPIASDAQQPAKVYHISFLSGSSPGTSRHLIEAFQQGLRELGYIEGKNIVIEFRWAEGRFERLPDLAAELVRLKVDVIVATAGQVIPAAKNATRTIPIVTIVAVDPVETGLVASLARPGGNITGLTFTVGPGIAGKRLEFLKVAVPKASRVAVLWNPTYPGGAAFLRETEVAAGVLRMQLHPLEVRSPVEFESTFAAMTRWRADALIVISDPLMFLHRTQLADLAAKRRLPTMWVLREYVEAGGLMAYGVHLPDLYRRAAVFVEKILQGAKPADLPMEQPTGFELVINRKTANALGLTIPRALLTRADHVID